MAHLQHEELGLYLNGNYRVRRHPHKITLKSNKEQGIEGIQYRGDIQNRILGMIIFCNN